MPGVPGGIAGSWEGDAMSFIIEAGLSLAVMLVVFVTVSVVLDYVMGMRGDRDE